VLALCAVLAACAGDDDDAITANGNGASAPTNAVTGAPTTTGAGARVVEAGCRVGERPDYFVPGGEHGVISGCARLSVSGKRVIFSTDREGIGGRPYVCFNPAYAGRGKKGIYIPAICPSTPWPDRVDVVSAEVPRQAVSGYKYVVWGTAPRSTRAIVARATDSEARGALFTVGRRLSTEVGAERPFTLFVLELPLGFRCQRIVIAATDGPQAVRDRTTVDRPRYCT
jgi:hypothetical protein